MPDFFPGLLDLAGSRKWAERYLSHDVPHFGGFSAPKEIRVDGILQKENQGSQGSCTGHAQTSIGEYCEYVATGGKIQLCRQFAYIVGQRESGITGDRGATIQGVCEASKKVGMCLEERWPYTGRYTTAIPPECFKEAENHRMKSLVNITSHQALIDFIGQGLGAVNIGIEWRAGVANCRDEWLTANEDNGQVYGGHSVALIGYRDRDGAKWPGLFNSHAGWGDGQWSWVEPALIEQWLRAGAVFIGCSDLDRFTAPREWRDVNWVEAMQ